MSDLPRTLALLANLLAFVLWAMATLVFKQLEHLPVWQVFAWRVLASLLCCLLLLGLTRQLSQALASLSQMNHWPSILASSLLIACNWLLVIWAIANGQLLGASLGYFLSPLLSVWLAQWLFDEPLNWSIALSSLVCLSGVVLIMQTDATLSGTLLGLVIASSFAAYGVLRKRSPLPALIAASQETALIAVPAMGILVTTGLGSTWVTYNLTDTGLLLSLGLLTTLPLWLYVHSLAHLPLSLVGWLQYLNPSLMFVIAIVFFEENISPTKLLGFGLIWGALLGLLLANIWQNLWPQPKQPQTESP